MRNLILFVVLIFMPYMANGLDRSYRVDIPKELTQPYLEELFKKAYASQKESFEDWFSNIEEEDVATGRREILVKTALDLGLNLDYLSKYGLENQGGRLYVIDLGENPQWVSLADIMRVASSPGFLATNSESLLDRGVPKSDLMFLKEYAINNPFMAAKFEGMLNFIRKAKEFSGLINDSGGHDNLYVRLMLTNNTMQADSERKWALEAVRQLSTRSKRILLEETLRSQKQKKFAVESLSYQEKKEAFFRSITDPEVEWQLIQQINQLKNKRKREDEAR